jgi:hypothetical protein
MARPTPEPIERAALFAAASSIPSRRPPRGPVDPNTMSAIESLDEVARSVGADRGDDAGGAPAGSVRAAARAVSFSCADSRSMLCS